MHLNRSKHPEHLRKVLWYEGVLFTCKHCRKCNLPFHCYRKQAGICCGFFFCLLHSYVDKYLSFHSKTNKIKLCWIFNGRINKVEGIGLGIGEFFFGLRGAKIFSQANSPVCLLLHGMLASAYLWIFLCKHIRTVGVFALKLPLQITCKQGNKESKNFSFYES